MGTYRVRTGFMACVRKRAEVRTLLNVVFASSSHRPTVPIPDKFVSETNQSGWSCSDVLARLPEHLDGELPPELDTRIREHLAVCHDCLARTVHEKAFLRAVRSKREMIPATDTLRARIERSLRGGERSERSD